MVDIFSKIGPEFATNIESKNWAERKEALDSLLTALEASSDLEKSLEYDDLLNSLIKVSFINTELIKLVLLGARER